MTEKQATELLKAVAIILEKDMVTVETKLPEPHLDSLSRVELAMRIEDIFDTEMNDDATMRSSKTVGDIFKYCESIR